MNTRVDGFEPVTGLGPVPGSGPISEVSVDQSGDVYASRANADGTAIESYKATAEGWVLWSAGEMTDTRGCLGR